MLTQRTLLAAVTTLALVAVPRSLPAADRIPLQALGSGLVAVQVEIAGTRLRMLVDTGATHSLIRATIAERLHLAPRARLPLHTATGVVEGLCAGTIPVRVGGVTVPVDCLGWSRDFDEAAFGDVLDGVLAADALAALPVLIDPGRGHLVLGEGALAVTGVEVPLALVEGRPAVALVPRGADGDRPLQLVVDSGADELVLFGAVAATAQAEGATRVATLTGGRQVEVAPVQPFSGLRRSPRRALLLPAVTDRGEDGLLPLSAAGPVAFDWRRGVAILGARQAALGR